jgi:hypothetical protein
MAGDYRISGPNLFTADTAAVTPNFYQDLDVSGLGWTPKAAIVEIIHVTALNTFTTTVRLSRGAAVSATKRWCIGSYEENAAGTSICKAVNINDRLGAILSTGSTISYILEFVDFHANGMRVQWQNSAGTATAPPTAVKLRVTYFGGADLGADAGVDVVGATANSTVSPTTTIAPTLLFIACPFQAFNARSAGTIRANATVNWGWASDITGSIEQTTMVWRETDAGTAMLTGGVVAPTARVATLPAVTTSAAEVCGLEVTAMGASSFTLTTRTASITAGAGWLALDLGDRQIKIGTTTPPTATTTAYTFSSLAFTPQFVELSGGAHIAANTFSIAGPSESMFVYGFDQAGIESGWALLQDDANTASQASIAATDKLFYGDYNSGNRTLYDMPNAPAMTATGWTIPANHTTVQGTACVWAYLAIQGPTHTLVSSNASGTSTADNVVLPLTLGPANATGTGTAANEALSQTHTLVSAVATSSATNTATSAALSQTHTLVTAVATSSATNTATTVALGETHLLVSANASGTSAAPTVEIETTSAAFIIENPVGTGTASTAALAQTHTLVATNAVGTGTSATVPLIQKHELWSAVDNTGSGTASDVILTGTHILTSANAVGSGTAADEPIVQSFTLAAANVLSTGSTASTAALGETHLISPAGAVGSATSSAPAIASTHVLAAANSAGSGTASNATLHLLLYSDVGVSSGTADNVAITSTHVMAMANAVGSSQASAVVLPLYLGPANAVGTGTASAALIVESHLLQLAACVMVGLGAALALTQTHLVAPATASTIGSTAEDAELPYGAALDCDPLLITGTADGVFLLQEHLLASDATISIGTADDVSTYTEVLLSVDDLFADAVLESVGLQIEIFLQVEDAESLASADDLDLLAALPIGSYALVGVWDITDYFETLQVNFDGVVQVDQGMVAELMRVVVTNESSLPPSEQILQIANAICIGNAMDIEQLGTHLMLAPADAVMTGTADDAVMPPITLLLVLDPLFSNSATADSVTLIVPNVLGPVAAVGTGTADGVPISSLHDIVVENGTSEGRASNIEIDAVDTAVLLTENARSENSVATVVVLGQAHKVTLPDAVTVITVSSVALGQKHAVVASGATGTGTGSPIAIAPRHLLAAANGTGTATAPAVALGAPPLLVITNAVGLGNAQSVSIGIPHIPQFANAQSIGSLATTVAVIPRHLLTMTNPIGSGNTAQSVAVILGPSSLTIANAVGTGTAISVAVGQGGPIVLVSLNATSAGSTAQSVALGLGLSISSTTPTILDVSDKLAEDYIVTGNELLYTFGGSTLTDVNSVLRNTYPKTTAFGQVLLGVPAGDVKVALKAVTGTAFLQRRQVAMPDYTPTPAALEWPLNTNIAGLVKPLSKGAITALPITFALQIKSTQVLAATRICMGLYTGLTAVTPTLRITNVSNTWAAQFTKNAVTATAGATGPASQSINKWTTIIVRFTPGAGGVVNINLRIRDWFGLRVYTAVSTQTFAGSSYSHLHIGAGPTGTLGMVGVIRRAMVVTETFTDGLCDQFAADDGVNWQKMVVDKSTIAADLCPTVARPFRDMVDGYDFTVNTGNIANVVAKSTNLGKRMRGENRLARQSSSANVFSIPYSNVPSADFTITAGESLWMTWAKHAVKLDLGTAPNTVTRSQLLPAGVNYVTCAGGTIKGEVVNSSGLAGDTGSFFMQRLVYEPFEYKVGAGLGSTAMVTKTYNYTVLAVPVVRNVGVYKPLTGSNWPVVVHAAGLGGEFDDYDELAAGWADAGFSVCVMEFQEAGEAAPWPSLDAVGRIAMIKQFCEQFIVDALGYTPPSVVASGHSGGCFTWAGNLGLKIAGPGGTWVINTPPAIQGGAPILGAIWFAAQGQDSTTDPNMSSWRTFINVPMLWITGSADDSSGAADDGNNPSNFFWRYQGFENIDSTREAYCAVIMRGDHTFGGFTGRAAQASKPYDYLMRRMAINVGVAFVSRCLNRAGALEFLQGCGWRPDPIMMMWSTTPGVITLPPYEHLSAYGDDMVDCEFMDDPNVTTGRIRVCAQEDTTLLLVIDDLDPYTLRYQDPTTKGKKYTVATAMLPVSQSFKAGHFMRFAGGTKWSMAFAAKRGADTQIRIYEAIPTLDASKNPTAWTETALSLDNVSRINPLGGQWTTRNRPIISFAGGGFLSYLDAGTSPQTDHHMTVSDTATNGFRPETNACAGINGGQWIATTHNEDDANDGQVQVTHSDTGVTTVITADGGLNATLGKVGVLFDPFVYRDANGTLTCVSQVNANALRVHKCPTPGGALTVPFTYLRDIQQPAAEAGYDPAVAHPQSYEPFNLDSKSYGVFSQKATDDSVVADNTLLPESQIWVVSEDGLFKLRVDYPLVDILRHEGEALCLNGSLRVQANTGTHAAIMYNAKIPPPDNKFMIWMARLTRDPTTGYLKLLDNGGSWQGGVLLKTAPAVSVGSTTSNVTLNQAFTPISWFTERAYFKLMGTMQWFNGEEGGATVTPPNRTFSVQEQELLADRLDVGWWETASTGLGGSRPVKAERDHVKEQNPNSVFYAYSNSMMSRSQNNLPQDQDAQEVEGNKLKIPKYYAEGTLAVQLLAGSPTVQINVTPGRAAGLKPSNAPGDVTVNIQSYVTWLLIVSTAGTELMKITGVAGTVPEVATCVRGWNGTTALTHPAGSIVLAPVYTGPHNPGGVGNGSGTDNIRYALQEETDETCACSFMGPRMIAFMAGVDGMDDIFLDLFTPSFFNHVDAKNAAVAQPWNFTTSNLMTELEHRDKREIQITKLRALAVAAGRSIGGIGNNINKDYIAADGGGEAFFQSTVLKPVPMRHMIWESFVCHGYVASSISEWAKNVGEWADQCAKNYPIIVGSKPSNAWEAVPKGPIHSTADWEKWERYDVAAMLMGYVHNVSPAQVLAISPLMDHLSAPQGAGTWEFHFPSYLYLDLGKPVSPNPTGTSITAMRCPQYSEPGNHTHLRIFERGLVLVNPSPLSDSIATLIPSARHYTNIDDEVDYTQILMPANTEKFFMAWDFQVTQGAPNGTVIGTVAGSHGNPPYTYTVPGGSPFAINLTTGVMTVAAAFTYQPQSRYAVNVSIKNSLNVTVVVEKIIRVVPVSGLNVANATAINSTAQPMVLGEPITHVNAPDWFPLFTDEWT